MQLLQFSKTCFKWIYLSPLLGFLLFYLFKYQYIIVCLCVLVAMACLICMILCFYAYVLSVMCICACLLMSFGPGMSSGVCIAPTGMMRMAVHSCVVRSHLHHCGGSMLLTLFFTDAVYIAPPRWCGWLYITVWFAAICITAMEAD